MNKHNYYQAILEIQNLDQYFRDFASVREIHFKRFLTNINLMVYDNEVLGIVGESGCGKTTLGRCIVGLVNTITGKILYKGKDIFHLQNNNMIEFRKNVQMIFQNPRSSLNINLTVKELIREAVQLHSNEPPPKRLNSGLLKILTPFIKEHSIRLLEKIRVISGFRSQLSNYSNSIDHKVEALVKRMKLEGREGQYPYELSGGERRRVGIARLMAVRPNIIIADEPVSNLDVSIKGFIIELLLEYKNENNATILFITHDMHLVNRICDRIVVMFNGHIIEIFKPQSYHLSTNHHPYTRKLDNVSQYFADTSKHTETQESSNNIHLETQKSSGCVYYPFCFMHNEKGITKTCEKEMPDLCSLSPKEHFVACHAIYI